MKHIDISHVSEREVELIMALHKNGFGDIHTEIAKKLSRDRKMCKVERTNEEDCLTDVTNVLLVKSRRNNKDESR